jgi:hypothetical protein
MLGHSFFRHPEASQEGRVPNVQSYKFTVEFSRNKLTLLSPRRVLRFDECLTTVCINAGSVPVRYFIVRGFGCRARAVSNDVMMT